METYLFYTNGKTTKVHAKNTLSPLAVQKLQAAGFKKHHQEVEAENAKDACAKLNALNESNLKALGEFSGNHLFAAALFIIICATAYFVL